MAATGKTPILLYGSTTATNTPTAGNLTNSSDGCEIAINVADKNLFFKDSTNTVNTVPIRQSSGSSDGWLSSANWTTFNGKQDALVSGTNIKTVNNTTLLGSGDLGTIGVGYGGTGTSTAFTAGSVVFAGTSGVYTQDNSNLFWDDTNNRLGIGTTSPGVSLQINGGIKTTNSGSTQASFARSGGSNTAALTLFQGSLDSYVSSTTAAAVLHLATQDTARATIDASGNLYPAADNSYTCGKSGNRWKEIWAANGTIQTSDAKSKTDILESDLGLEFIEKLNPVSYRMVVAENIVNVKQTKEVGEEAPIFEEIVTQRAGVRRHYGLIAQEVKEALGSNDAGIWINDKQTGEQGLRYEELIAPMIKAIQQLKAEIDTLKAAK